MICPSTGNILWSRILIVILSNAGLVIVSGRYANYTGDILLGSFFPVHTYQTAGPSVRSPTADICAGIQDQDGIQPLEAMMYSLDLINQDPSFLPGFTIGTIAMDSCDNELHALSQASGFLKVLVIRHQSEDFPYHCKDGSKPQPSAAAQDVEKIVGVLGGASSTVSIQLASVFRLFQMPQISYQSTSPDLSNQDRFPFFKRTVPSDINQAKALVEIFKAFNWTYVSAVVEDSNYGNKGFQGVEREAQKAGICFATKLTIDFDEQWWGDDHYDEIITNLRKKPRAKAVLLYAGKPQARKLLEAAKRMNASREFVWVGSDAWSGRDSISTGLEETVYGSVTVQPLARKIPGFDDYFKMLKPQNNTRNPWFREYWEGYFQCKFANTSNNHSNIFQRPQTGRICTGEEQISESNGYRQQLHLHYVSDAVLAYAHALKRMHSEVCGQNFSGICDAMKIEELKGLPLLMYLDVTNFTSASGLPFSFENISDGPPRYSIMTYTDGETSGSYQWSVAGQYSGVADETRLQFEPNFIDTMSRYPRSSCSDECTIGQAAKMIEGEQCCWICVNCTANEITVSSDVCVACAKGRWPNVYRNECIAIQEDYLRFSSPWAATCMICACIGVILCLVVGVIFFIYKDTPIVKASGRELSVVLLIGVLICYLATFAFVSKPHPVSCAFSRFLLGFCYTVLYASVLTKTNRISRIFNDGGSSPKKTRYTSPRSQIIIVAVIILPEVIILIAWLVASPPSVTNIYPTLRENVIVCKGLEDASYLIPLAYPLLLIFLCTIYAIKTRKTPDGFNETRLIAFTSYTTVVIWLAFIPLYFFAQNSALRVTTLCASMSLNGTVALACMFGPKVYICLFRPHKNTRDAVMARSSSVISSVQGSQNSKNAEAERNHQINGAPVERCRRCSVSIDDVTFTSSNTDAVNVSFRSSPEKELVVITSKQLNQIPEEVKVVKTRNSLPRDSTNNNNLKDLLKDRRHTIPYTLSSSKSNGDLKGKDETERYV